MMSESAGVFWGLLTIWFFVLCISYYHLRRAEKLLREVAKDMGKTVSGLSRFGEELDKLHESVDEFGRSMQRAAVEAERAALQFPGMSPAAKTGLRLIDSDEPGAG